MAKAAGAAARTVKRASRIPVRTVVMLPDLAHGDPFMGGKSRRVVGAPPGCGARLYSHADGALKRADTVRPSAESARGVACIAPLGWVGGRRGDALWVARPARSGRCRR